jgi:hypothetical protein
MKERRGNVYENKGLALSSPERSGNAVENAGSYAMKAGILLKIQAVRLRWLAIGAGRATSRYQVSGARSQDSGLRSEDSGGRGGAQF